MDIYTKDCDWFINKVKKDEFFSYTRWNDGEWFCMEGKPGANCDGQRYYPQLGRLLVNALQKESNRDASKEGKYIFESGLWWKPQALFDKDIINMNIRVPFLKGAITTSIWQNPSKWIDLIQTLNGKTVVVIGPAYLKKYKPLRYKHFIEIPHTNCITHAKKVISQIRTLDGKVGDAHKNIVFVFAASMATNVIVDHLFEDFKDKHFMLDFGSAFDIFIEDPIFTGGNTGEGRRRSTARGSNRKAILDKYPKEWRSFS